MVVPRHALVSILVAAAYVCSGSQSQDAAAKKVDGESAGARSTLECAPGERQEGSRCVAIAEPNDPADAWVQTSGPPTGADSFVEIAADGTVYVSGLGGGLFRSTDGETWSLTGVFVPRYYTITDLQLEPTNPQTVWAKTLHVSSVGNFDHRIFKSQDGAETWTEVTAPADVVFTGPFAVSSTVPGAVIASTETGRIFISDDGGATWTERPVTIPSPPPETPQIRAVAAAAAGEFWVGPAWGDNGILHSTDSGATWSLEPTVSGLTMPDGFVSDILVDPVDDRRVYVAFRTLGEGSGFINMARTDDAGATWHDITVGSHDFVAILSSSGATVFVANGNNILRSPDRGLGWEPFVDPAGASDAAAVDPIDIAVDPVDPNILYLPTNGRGISKSTDGGLTWHRVNTGLQAAGVSQVSTLARPPGGLITNGSRCVYRSYDWGETWTQLSFPYLIGQVDEIAVSPQNTDRVWVVSDTGSLYESYDQGDTFELVFQPMPPSQGFRYGSIYGFAVGPPAEPGSPERLYAVKSGFGIWRSDDGGNHWRFLLNSEVDYSYTLAVDPHNSDIIFSGYNPKPFETFAKIRRSLDGGETWDTPLTIDGSTGVTSIVIDPLDDTRIYTGSTSPLGGQVWRSTDGGVSFEAVPGLTFANVHAFASHPRDPAGAIAALWGGGTYVTVDSGATWLELVEPPTVSASAVMIAPDDPPSYYLADRASPRIFHASGAGPMPTWSTYFDAGESFYRVLTAALAPSDSARVYASVLGHDNPMSGSLFRIDDSGGVDVTGNLTTVPSALAVDPRDANTVYAICHGAGSGVFKSVDGGVSWASITGPGSGIPQSPALGFNGIVVDPHTPETVYLFGGSDAYFSAGRIGHTGAAADDLYTVYRSQDGGATWTNLNDGHLGIHSGPIKGLVVSSANPNLIFVAARDEVLGSSDGGASWAGVSTGRSATELAGVALSSNDVTIFAPTLGGGVHAGAVDQGTGAVTWETGTTLAAPVYHVQVAVDPSASSTLFASAYPGGVFKSSDGGDTWSEANFGLPTVRVDDPLRQGYYALAIAPSRPEVLYLGIFGRGVYRSDDGAATWLPRNGTGDAVVDGAVAVLLVSPTDADTVWASTDSGVFETTDGGRTWVDISTGLGNTDVRTLRLLADGTLIAGTRGDELYRLNTGTTAWEQMPPLDDLGQPWLMWGRGLYQYTSILFHPSDPNVVYIGTFPAGVYKSEDGGTTWREKNVGFTNDGIFYITFRPDDPRIIYAGTYNGVNRSTDGAEHWEVWDRGWPSEQWVFDISFDPSDADIIYACSLNGQNQGHGVEGFHGTVMKSTNAGASWAEITTGLPDQQFYGIEVDPRSHSTVYLAGELGVYRSTNGGESWAAWSEGLLNPMAAHPNNVTRPLGISKDGHYLFLGSEGSGLFRRRIGGDRHLRPRRPTGRPTPF